MPKRYLREQNSLEVSNDTSVSKSLEIEEEDELLQIFLNSSLDTAAEEERKLALLGPKPVTMWPRSLRFDSLTPEPTNCTAPVILVALLEALDKVVPPVDKILNGLTEESMRNCDSLLGHLVSDVGKTNRVLCDHLLASLSPGELAQMLQLLFLRFERPVFEALPELCQFIHRRIFYMDPRMSRCRAKDVVFTNGSKQVQQSVDQMSPPQKAILATFLKYCQRWCQAHVGTRLREDGKRNSVSEYTEAIHCLSGLFCGGLIGIPRAYISASFRSDDAGSVNALKRDVFTFLLTMTSIELWHSITFRQLVAEEKLPTRDVVAATKEGPDAKSITVTISGSATPQKTKSFNWI